ncbi:SET domain-containing protein 5 [Ilyonectria robusta]
MLATTTPIEAGTRISSGTPSIHALRDIEEGHEITIYYLNTLLSRETRQEALRTTFMFTCSCRLCSLPRHQSQESDRRLDEILRLEASIVEKGLVGYISAPERTLRYADRIVCLYNEHRPDDGGLPRAFLSAAHIAIVHGDLARAQIFVERARLGWTALEGDDSHLQVTLLSQDPSKSKSYGLSMKWKTSVDEIPKELAPEEFEDWLWRRQKPRQPGQPVNFRDQAVFPSFMNLPNETDADPIFFESRDGLAYRPRQHWCFLAEIVSFDTLARLRMDVKDVDGKTVRLIFYTEGRGSEMAPSQIRNGYTIAILYAQRHAFSILETGIRHGEPVKLKVFPTSLNKLLALSDRVQTFSTETNGNRVCHGCGTQAPLRNRCAKCSLFWYCNTACQTAGWHEKGHKADCKLLRDADLKGLLHLTWEKFEGHVAFPLRT